MSQDSNRHKQKATEEGRVPKEEATPAEPRSGQKRRKFIKAGLIGAPILLTLKGRKAWADSGGSGGSSNAALKTVDRGDV